MRDGIVFDIQHFCVDDGPGIRTTVFFKGCPLRCVWCHNPEGLSGKPQLFYSVASCSVCQACAAVCPNACHRFVDGTHTVDFSSCVACGLCVDACPNEALRICGKCMTVEEVLSEVMTDRPFFETSGGGVTFSGGEPMLQADFVCELAKRAKENGIHVCMETSGFCTEDDLRRVSRYVDLFLFDMKHDSAERHKRLTGVDHFPILENLDLLKRLEKSVVLRCPIIPNCNDHRSYYLFIARLANQMSNIQAIHIEPYHPFGVDKYAAIGRTATYDRREMASSERIKEAEELIRSHTNTAVLIT